MVEGLGSGGGLGPLRVPVSSKGSVKVSIISF